MNGQLFKLGTICHTPGILERFEMSEILGFIARHVQGDFGILCEDDMALNRDAIRQGDDRVFSAYETARGKVWVITEADRSVTTVLLPSEY